ncbi:MAG TPA: cytochrome c biogenesis protein CcsA [Longimicrobiales bacterium]|nr:cytochrome c biogenesis protein CcsA [Longimicrobiales bacterium]
MMVTILFATALILYVGASAALAASFAGGRVAAPRAGTALVAGAVAFHGAALVIFTTTYAELPLVGLAPSLSTLAFFIALLLFGTTLTRDSRPLGIVLVPLTAVLLAIALIIGIAPSGEPLAFSGVWFSFHVLLAFVGYAGLAVAFAAGLLYLLQFRELKDKRLGRVFRFFPSLPALDTIGRRGVAVGFPALTAALLLGWAWTISFRNTVAAGDPEVIWGVLTWITFAVLVGVRYTQAPNIERRAAFASVAGFVFVVLSYLVLRLFVAGEVFL